MSTSSSSGAALTGRGFLAKLALFAFLVAAAQNLAAGFVLPDEVKRLDALLEDAPEIIVYGNSTATAMPGDTDLRSIPDLIAEALPGTKVAPLIQLASSGPLYEAYTRRMLVRSRLPSAIVVPVNLCSFSAYWSRRPQYQFAEVISAVDFAERPFISAWHRPAAIFKLIDFAPVDDAAFTSSEVKGADGRSRGTVGEFLPQVGGHDSTSMRRQLELFFLHGVTEKDMAPFVEIARNTRMSGVRAIFYISPVDIETGVLYCGPEFETTIRENASAAVTMLEREGAEVIDLSASLPSGHFFREWTSDEHMLAAGRRVVAARVAERINVR